VTRSDPVGDPRRPSPQDWPQRMRAKSRKLRGLVAHNRQAYTPGPLKTSPTGTRPGIHDRVPKRTKAAEKIQNQEKEKANCQSCRRSLRRRRSGPHRPLVAAQGLRERFPGVTGQPIQTTWLVGHKRPICFACSLLVAPNSTAVSRTADITLPTGCLE
jgi:hypothetical protein